MLGAVPSSDSDSSDSLLSSSPNNEAGIAAKCFLYVLNCCLRCCILCILFLAATYGCIRYVCKGLLNCCPRLSFTRWQCRLRVVFIEMDLRSGSPTLQTRMRTSYRDEPAWHAVENRNVVAYTEYRHLFPWTARLQCNPFYHAFTILELDGGDHSFLCLEKFDQELHLMVCSQNEIADYEKLRSYAKENRADDKPRGVRHSRPVQGQPRVSLEDSVCKRSVKQLLAWLQFVPEAKVSEEYDFINANCQHFAKDLQRFLRIAPSRANVAYFSTYLGHRAGHLDLASAANLLDEHKLADHWWNSDVEATIYADTHVHRAESYGEVLKEISSHKIEAYAEYRHYFPYTACLPFQCLQHCFSILRLSSADNSNDDGPVYLSIEKSSHSLVMRVGRGQSTLDKITHDRVSFNSNNGGEVSARRPVKCESSWELADKVVRPDISVQDLVSWLDMMRFQPYDLISANCHHFTEDLQDFLIYGDPRVVAETRGNERQAMLGAVQEEGGYVLHDAPFPFKRDFGFVLEVVKQDGMALQWVAKPFQSDPDIVQAAVQQDPRSLQFAAAEMKNQDPHSP